MCVCVSLYLGVLLLQQGREEQARRVSVCVWVWVCGGGNDGGGGGREGGLLSIFFILADRIEDFPSCCFLLSVLIYSCFRVSVCVGVICVCA